MNSLYLLILKIHAEFICMIFMRDCDAVVVVAMLHIAVVAVVAVGSSGSNRQCWGRYF